MSNVKKIYNSNRKTTVRNFEKIVKKNKYSPEEYETISKRSKKLNKPKRSKPVDLTE